jgi:hypothetical protein
VPVCLELKGIGYPIDPAPPWFGDDRSTRQQPLRPIAVLIDEAVMIVAPTPIAQRPARLRQQGPL